MTTLIREAAILVGGKGTRLKTQIHDRPKPMAEVDGRPFVEWLLLMLARQGIERVVLCTGFMAEYIENHFRKGSWQGIEVACCRESRPMGTGGALRNGLAAIGSDRLLVLNGDSYSRLALGALRDALVRDGAVAAMQLVYQEDTSRYGTVSFGDDGRVTLFNEKAGLRTGGYINTGIYAMNKELIREIPPETEFSLEHDLFPGRIGKGVFAVVAEGPFVDIGTPHSYSTAARILSADLALLDKEKERAST